MKEKRNIIDISRANKFGLLLELIIIVILTISYLVQILKGSISAGNFVILLITLWVPVALARIIYRKNPSSELIKHFIGIGYGLFYVAICLISDEQMVFTFAFPMVIVCTVYCDLKFSVTVGIAVSAVSIGHGILCTAKAGFSPVAIAALEIQIAATVLIAVYSALGNKFIIGISQEKVDEINDATKKTEEVLENIVRVSNTLAEEVTEVSDKMISLGTSSQEIYDAMQEVSSGSNETAESVQNQLIKTEEIQNQVDLVTKVSNGIGDAVSNAVLACHEGSDNINELLKKSKISEEAGIEVVREVEELRSATEKMESIVALINNVASQTSLLALNASIEAARAGEAGKGFAVVASEISNLASQTQNATGNISELIESLSSEMNEVVESINSLVENNRSQNESANITSGSFEKINENIRNIRNNSNELSGAMGKLVNANQEIIESIQTISAISEQVSAHSSNTCSTSEKNKYLVDEINVLVDKMSANADELARMKE